MNRRDFVKTLGINTAAIASATALSNLSGVEPRIKTLEKKIIMPSIHDIIVPDIIIFGVTFIDYKHIDNYKKILSPSKEEYLMADQYNSYKRIIKIGIEREYCVTEKDFDKMIDDRGYGLHFTIQFKENIFLGKHFEYLRQFNGRLFKTTKIDSDLRSDRIPTIELTGMEIIQ